MTFFRKRQDPGLEDRLRNLGGEPSEDFVRSLATEVRASRLRTTMRSRRVVAAVVTTGLMLIPFAAFGGIGYAAQAAKSAAQSVAKSDSKASDNKAPAPAPAASTSSAKKADEGKKVEEKKPDDDQYKPGKGCGDKNHVHTREDDCKKPAK